MTAARDDEHTYDTLTAALQAWDAGVCVITVHADGTKSPVGSWKKWQTERPSRDTVTRWFKNGHPGLGVICGKVSGNLELLEFEGSAVRDGTWDTFLQRCDDEGLTPVIDRIIAGYAEKSPSDGNHLLYRCDEIAGNTKLARATIKETLIETRGEGGFVVVAPSHGAVHTTGVPWELVSGSFATIATITPDERTRLFDICREFNKVTGEDLAKPLTEAMVTSITIAKPNTTSGESWFEQVVNELARKPWIDVLGQYGWEHGSTVQGIDYWRRPGKTDGGWSATTNAKGTDRLIVFSSNTPFVEYTGRGPAPSYDRLDVIATYSHGGDRVAAARALAGRDTITLGVSNRSSAPANVDPDTGEILADAESQAPTGHVLLPDEFWTARPIFDHIRTAARARMIAPDALFGAVLAKVALMTDNRYVLPPIVGRYGTLDFLLGLVGKSGAGKGSTLDTCDNMLATGSPARDYRTASALVGSGEGMVHAYYEQLTEKVDGRNKTVWKRKVEGLLFRIDEGQALTALAARSGQTTMTTLRQAWSGESLGGSYASSDKKVTLNAGTYRFVGVMAIQPALAKDMLSDYLGGTPQRFVWLSLSDPGAPDHTPEWPGSLPWEPPVWSSTDAQPIPGGLMKTVIPVCTDVTKYVQECRRKSLRTGGTDDEHAQLRRLKVSALLAILDERLEVTWDDWELAEMVHLTSEAAVSAMREAIKAEADKAINRDVTKAVTIARATEVARAEVADETSRAARQIAKHVRKHHGETSKTCGRRCITIAMRSDLRGAFVDGMSRAVALGWVDEDGESGWIPGRVESS